MNGDVLKAEAALARSTRSDASEKCVRAVYLEIKGSGGWQCFRRMSTNDEKSLVVFVPDPRLLAGGSGWWRCPMSHTNQGGNDRVQ